MGFQNGTATGYQDLFDKLVAFATSQQMTAVAINAGGTGYTVGDVLTVSGGTFTFAATLEVTAVSSGAVTGVKMLTAGAYSVTPSNSVSVTGGTGSGATFDLTFSAGGWTSQRNGQYLHTIQINAGGTGYAVGNILTISGGTSTIAAQVQVATVSSGVITAVNIINKGFYTAVPTNPASVTGGAGTGATFNLTFQKEVILLGTGSGSDEIYVGFRTYTDDGTDAQNLELAGMTGYNSALVWDLQPGISPGRYHDSVPLTEGGAFVPLDDASFPFWFNVDPRRIILVCRPGTSSYMQGYVGFLNPFNTTTEWPYPICVAGSTCQKETRFNTSRAALNGIHQPISKSTGTSPAICDGPVMVRWFDGTWITFRHFLEASGAANTTKSNQSDRVLTPPQRTTRTNDNASNPMFLLALAHQWFNVFPESGTNPAYELRGSPDSGGNLPVLWPMTFNFSTTPTPEQFVGQYDEVYWVSVYGSGLTNEDEIDIGNDSYILFQGGNQSDSFNYIAMKRTW